jgi:serine/threonine protein phosphatase PrpC
LIPESLSLAGGGIVSCTAWGGDWPADCRRPLAAADGDRTYRLYALNPDCWRGLGAAVRRRAGVTLDVLAAVEIIPAGDGAVVAATALPAARPAVAPVLPAEAPQAGLPCLLNACRTLAAALRPLHDAGYLWLPFDPDSLEAAGDRLQIANLDLQLFHAGEPPTGLGASGPYPLPELCLPWAERAGRAADVYHLSLYAYYRLAGLLPHGFPGKGPEAFNFEFPPLRVYCPRLPVGVTAVVARGLARLPAQRFASAADFLAALEEAIDRTNRRQTARPGPLRYDLGGRTVAGRARSALGRPNQDEYRTIALGGGEVPAVVVADGVSFARVGDGRLASQTACDELAAVLPGLLAQAESPRQRESALEAACLEAGRAILRRTLAQGPLPAEVDCTDLMSTTALLATIRDGVLTLANVGDSRAYLLREAVIEQLTVDGDLGCAALADGMPPEEVLAQRDEALGLFACLGVSERGPDGRLRCCVVRSIPQVTHWPLCPGDVILLCTDGLIEDGVFLDPADVANFVSTHPELGAQDLADRLIELADARQRPPTADEPEGFGDNITCAVIRVLPDR